MGFRFLGHFLNMLLCTVPALAAPFCFAGAGNLVVTPYYTHAGARSSLHHLLAVLYLNLFGVLRPQRTPSRSHLLDSLTCLVHFLVRCTLFRISCFAPQPTTQVLHPELSMPSTRGFHARGLFSFGSSAESPQAMWKPQQAIARLPALPSCAVAAPLFHLEPQSKTFPTSKCAVSY